mmetsp:Transcript_54765/g.97452  ORF Transcript_54765/g.97452 Transcript_54765/m.97452 type:complete len:151 (+) Transcript_54765:2760-3212(+)
MALVPKYLPRKGSHNWSLSESQTILVVYFMMKNGLVNGPQQTLRIMMVSNEAASGLQGPLLCVHSPFKPLHTNPRSVPSYGPPRLFMSCSRTPQEKKHPAVHSGSACMNHINNKRHKSPTLINRPVAQINTLRRQTLPSLKLPVSVMVWP